MAAAAAAGGAATAVISSPSADAWQVEFAQALPELEWLSRLQLPPWPLRVLRSSQLDASRLDAELLTMLQEQFMSVFRLFPQGRVASLEPELNLLLALLVFWLSVWQGRATPGSDLMNLRYRDETAMDKAAAAAAAAAAGQQQQGELPPWLHGGRSGIEGPGLSRQQRAAYAVGFVAAPYLWTRLNRHAAQREWGQQPGDVWGMRAWRLLRGLGAAHKLSMLANLWLFLYEGKYRTLVERAIGARLVYKRANMSRLISFEYLNRQLVWQELSEFLLFLLPLINVAALRRFVLRLLPRMPALGSGSGDGGGPAAGRLQGYPVADKQQQQQQMLMMMGSDSSGRAARGSSSGSGQAAEAAEEQQQQQAEGTAAVALLLQPAGPCAVCGISEILLPYVAHPCRHVFCYYCLRGHCEADQGFCCPLDGRRVEAMQRYVRRLPV